jgi:hypothetical protein
MDAKTAKIFSDGFNKPVIEAYLKNNPIEDIYKDIETASKQGYYSLKTELGHNINPNITNFLQKAIIGKGFEVSQEKDKTKTFLNIFWV